MEEQTYVPKEYSAKGRELLFGIAVLLCGLLLSNFTVYGGFNLGFAIAVWATLLATTGYLLRCGHKLTGYSAALLGLSLAIAASFPRGQDSLVKLVMVVFLLVGSNLGLCLLAGQNHHRPGDPRSLLDAAFSLFNLGVGELSPATRGLSSALKRSGPMGQKATAILVGLGVCVPILIIMVPLLMRADAAFEGLMDLLPSFSLAELLCTGILGFLAAAVLYTQGVALHGYDRADTPGPAPAKGVSTLTINTVLTGVSLLYCLYLASQLAYFAGGFSGILPEGYTLAQYARRGFFEMAWLCAIDLALMALALGLSRKKDPAPLSTRLLCLFLGLVTLFLVATASAKMFFYIGAYGLTRLRVLTQVVMLFLALTTVLVCIRLFVPRLAYMKAVVLCALILGAAVSWADVDTVVAKYNVDAYLSGQLETVDVNYLNSLTGGALPHILRLSEEAPDPEIAQMARDVLSHRFESPAEDFRGWNYVNHIAAQLVPFPEDTQEVSFVETQP